MAKKTGERKPSSGSGRVHTGGTDEFIWGSREDLTIHSAVLGGARKKTRGSHQRSWGSGPNWSAREQTRSFPAFVLPGTRARGCSPHPERGEQAEHEQLTRCQRQPAARIEVNARELMRSRERLEIARQRKPLAGSGGTDLHGELVQRGDDDSDGGADHGTAEHVGRKVLAREHARARD